MGNWRNGVVCISTACALMAVLASALATLEDRNIIYFTVRYRRGFIKHVNCITKEGIKGPVYVEGRGETRGLKAIFHLQRGRNYV